MKGLILLSLNALAKKGKQTRSKLFKLTSTKKPILKGTKGEKQGKSFLLELNGNILIGELANLIGKIINSICAEKISAKNKGKSLCDAQNEKHAFVKNGLNINKKSEKSCEKDIKQAKKEKLGITKVKAEDRSGLKEFGKREIREKKATQGTNCLLYTSPSPRD